MKKDTAGKIYFFKLNLLETEMQIFNLQLYRHRRKHKLNKSSQNSYEIKYLTWNNGVVALSQKSLL